MLSALRWGDLMKGKGFSLSDAMKCVSFALFVAVALGTYLSTKSLLPSFLLGLLAVFVLWLLVSKFGI